MRLADLAVQAVELYKPLAEQRGLRLTAVIESEAQAQADAKLLFEAVSNLVDNALKFTPAGGDVQVRVRVSDEHDRPHLVVQDSGPGLAAHERSQVLQRFYRGEHVRATPGSGLGLSIVGAILRLHRFPLRFEDAEPGLRVVLVCRQSADLGTF